MTGASFGSTSERAGGPAPRGAVTPPASTRTGRAAAALIGISKIAALAAMAVLAVRAALRLDLWWDVFWYHLPFAAIRGGLGIPFEMSDAMALRYQGFPPLPHLIQGMLWRFTGSVNATGTVNYLAFCLFLAHCHFVLGARVWLVTLISLTAPLVVIHLATTYIDLFGNSFLAIALSSCLFIFIFPTRASRRIVVCALLGAIAAAWSKYQLVPIVFSVFPLMFIGMLRTSGLFGERSVRKGAVLIGVAAMLAAAPYIKNVVLYRNPFWPIQLPILSDVIPYKEARKIEAEQPPPLRGCGQYSIFLHSLFEIDHPTRYDHRPRWIVDQGSAWMAFRSGGFWAVGTIAYIVCLCALLVLNGGRSGIAAAAGVAATIGVVGFLPQSHELRYYLFLPLVWSAGIGMLFGVLEGRYPRVVPFFLSGVLGLFGFMVWENLPHYKIEQIGHREAADFWGASRWWPRLKSGERYCTTDIQPAAILLTGPSMREFNITAKTHAYLCPYPSTMLGKDGSQSPLTAETCVNESVKLFGEGRFEESLAAAHRAREIAPDYAFAFNNACAAQAALKRWGAAIADCKAALALAPDLQRAKNNLAWAEREAAAARTAEQR